MFKSIYRSSYITNNLFEILQVEKNQETTNVLEWGLFAKIDLPASTFLGFYTGTFSVTEKPSRYSLSVVKVHIYPFDDEDNITHSERLEHPLASMNEPKEDEEANCCFFVQDFHPHEVVHMEQTLEHIFRGVACFTCRDIRQGEELTWYYGKQYESIRREKGYKAGKPCSNLEELRMTIDSSSILRFLPKINRSDVWPIKKRRINQTSVFDSEEQIYFPPSESKKERLLRRNRRLNS
jgi:hypothetical protein